jgi:hypothetical protein
MTDTTFSTAVVIDTDTRDTEIEILRDGDCVGTIQRESINADGHLPSGGWYPRWVACSYEVVFLIDNDEIKDKYFEVDDDGHPRTALAAAKRYARETLNREVG